MASMRKIERDAKSAAQAYRSAAAEVVLATINERQKGREPYESAEVQRLKRRAGAHHAQWLAAERRVEEAMARR